MTIQNNQVRCTIKMNRSLKLQIALVLLLFLSSTLLPASWTDLSTASAQTNYCTALHQDVATPLNDLGNASYTRMDGEQTGYTGGLYPGGSNTRPPSHNAAGVSLAGQIVPLDPDGNPDPENGRIVMVSVGMSNANMEFRGFLEQARQDSEVNPQLLIVNGAIPGQTSEFWIEPDAYPWQQLHELLARYPVTAEQVQVAWVKNVRTGGGEFPEKAQILQSDLEAIARNLKINFPNIKIAYYTSRTRSYTYWSALSPEPAAYETGFAVKWLVEKQINGDPGLNYDPQRGPVVAPFLSWGPYIWADGENPRSDGLVWLQEDMVPDCTHPSDNGVLKVADQLLEFFKTDETAIPWFLENPPEPTPTPPVPRYKYLLPGIFSGGSWNISVQSGFPNPQQWFFSFASTVFLLASLAAVVLFLAALLFRMTRNK